MNQVIANFKQDLQLAYKIKEQVNQATVVKQKLMDRFSKQWVFYGTSGFPT